ncbi:hypothetical protein, partial [Escherichia coli]|uniref:hypothetical protein n=1 Tax=Escherichia coli TaxID=562 RepID=UPI003D012D85
GFDFPRYIARLDRRPMAKRLANRKPVVCGQYFGGSKPVQGIQERSFYLDSDFMIGKRWKWADEIDGARLNHTGWYSDEFGASEKIRGIVIA